MEFLYSLLLTSVVYNIMHVKPLSIMVIIVVNVAQRKLVPPRKKIKKYINKSAVYVDIKTSNINLITYV